MPSDGQPPGQAAPDPAAGAGDDRGLPRRGRARQCSSPSSTRVVSVSVLLSTTRCCVAAWRSRKHRCSTLGRRRRSRRRCRRSALRRSRHAWRRSWPGAAVGAAPLRVVARLERVLHDGERLEHERARARAARRRASRSRGGTAAGRGAVPRPSRCLVCTIRVSSSMPAPPDAQRERGVPGGGEPEHTEPVDRSAAAGLGVHEIEGERFVDASARAPRSRSSRCRRGP